MSVDYSKVRFEPRTEKNAFSSGLNLKEITRFIKQLWDRDLEGIKLNKKIQKKLIDRESSVCIWIVYLWAKNKAGYY